MKPSQTITREAHNAAVGSLDDLVSLGEQIKSARDHRRRRSAAAVWVIRVSVLAAVLAIWQALVSVHALDEVLVSKPSEIAKYIYHTVPTEAFWQDVWATFSAALIGLALGSVLGMGVAVLLYETPTVQRAMAPYVALLNGLPRPALAPLFLVWFGLGVLSKVSVVVTIVFFVLLVNTTSGLAAVDADHLHLARTLGMNRWQRLVHIQLQSAMPSIIAGLRLGAVYAVLGVVVSEMVASTSGLGLRLVLETNRFDIAGTFGVLLVLAVLATLLDFGVSVLERFIARRRNAER